VVGEKKNLMPNAANNKNIGCRCFYCHITAEPHHGFKVFETDNLTIHSGDPRNCSKLSAYTKKID
jgi:hypothetical protein